MKTLLLLLVLIFGVNPCAAYASEQPVNGSKPEESKELMFQDMLMLFLLPHIDKKIDEIYADLLKYSPEVYPYFVHVHDVRRVNGFRGFHFVITLEVIPTVGPHIAVGKDRLIFDISPTNPNNVRLLDWKHLEDPAESNFPPNWKDMLKKRSNQLSQHVVKTVTESPHDPFVEPEKDTKMMNLVLLFELGSRIDKAVKEEFGEINSSLYEISGIRADGHGGFNVRVHGLITHGPVQDEVNIYFSAPHFNSGLMYSGIEVIGKS
ncbi:DUF3888 domain-containing protein [Paenibacillus sp. GCM10023250]|uniref:DUF3888 domain-containing protein n=1 Tax=Paenibacillus sp. GCM10023250 TaxID=3252648 RepID=UPI00360C8D3D